MRHLALVAGLAMGLPACGAPPSNPEFAAKMGEACLTMDGCRALMDELDVARKECDVGRRPTNCEEREAQYAVVRRQVTLLDTTARARSEEQAQALREQERAAKAEALKTQHEAFTESAEVGQVKADQEAAWTRLDPKRCALQGDEEACYALVRFLAIAGDGPHAAEARAALEAGQRIIAQRPPSGAPGQDEPPKAK